MNVRQRIRVPKPFRLPRAVVMIASLHSSVTYFMNGSKTTLISSSSLPRPQPAPMRPPPFPYSTFPLALGPSPLKPPALREGRSEAALCGVAGWKGELARMPACPGGAASWLGSWLAPAQGPAHGSDSTRSPHARLVLQQRRGGGAAHRAGRQSVSPRRW